MDPQEESEIVYGDTEPDHPILYIPKHLITLQTSCAQSDDIFINLNITAADTQGIDMNVYSGLCNIKVIDNTNDDHNDHDHGDVEMDYPSNSRNVLDETTLPDPNDSIETLRLSAPSPNVSNDCEAEENYTIYQSHNEHVTLRQHGSYVKKNVMHYSQYVQYSPAMEFEHKKFKRMKMSNEPEPQAGPSSYEEFEWDLSQRRKVMLADESRAREEMEYIDMPNDNVAVKQLTSSEVQGSPRQQQTIRTNDPLVKCRENGLGCNVEHLDWRLAELRRLADECRAIEEMKYEDMPDDNVAVKQLTSSEVQESPRQQRTISTNDPLVKRCENGSGYNVDHPDLRLAELRRLADECRAIDEMKYEDMPNDNVAVKQLTSSEVQESPRQQRTISTNDPLVKHCENGSGYNVDHADLRLAELKRLADECRAIEEMKYEDMPNDNVAVKQLTSSEVQGSPRQQRTISTNDPLVKHCENGSGYNVEHPDCDWSLAELRRLADENRAREAMKYVDMPNANVAVKQLMSSEAGSSVVNNPCQKKYQCDKCKQIFNQMSAFRQHLEREKADEPTNNVRFYCQECSKSFKSREKFDMHRHGHGNPDVECNICRKVFASKFTLQNHIKIHLRKHKCQYCRKTYQKFEDLSAHLEKIHFIKSDICNSTSSALGSEKHEEKESKFGAVNSDSAEDCNTSYEESKQDDSEIAPATSN